MMKVLIASTMLLLAAPAAAQSVAGTAGPQASASRPVVVESYYRVKWGSEAEFKDLYKRNEAPLLIEMQRKGFITNLRFDEPFTHFPGQARWTIRATITYRDAPSAVEVGGPYDQAFEEARKRLRPDKKVFDAEQARRFALMEDHWDVIVTPFEPHK
jgi:hypothetical protein